MKTNTRIEDVKKLKKEWINTWELHDDKPERQADWWIKKITHLITTERERGAREEREKVDQNIKLIDTSSITNIIDGQIDDSISLVATKLNEVIEHLNNKALTTNHTNK